MEEESKTTLVNDIWEDEEIDEEILDEEIVDDVDEIDEIKEMKIIKPKTKLKGKKGKNKSYKFIKKIINSNDFKEILLLLFSTLSVNSEIFKKFITSRITINPILISIIQIISMVILFFIPKKILIE